MTHLDPDPRWVNADEVWATLERMPDFNERVRRGAAQLDRGERVPFEGDYRAGYDAAIEDCVSSWRSGAVIVAGALLFAGLLGAALSLAWRRG